MATWQMSLLQDSASPLMEQLMFFHDHTLMILIIITILVLQTLIFILYNTFSHRFLLEGQAIEMFWTILPSLVLVLIALPSLRLLYMIDENYNPMITVKVIGHQWFWSYEYSDYKTLQFDSYMIGSKELTIKDFRLLETDNRMVVPYNTPIRLIVTSVDVIHSWSIPALGIKIDATPGRLNQVNFYVNRPGLFYGQCSEICGTNHSFMPILIESVSMTVFLDWIYNNNVTN